MKRNEEERQLTKAEMEIMNVLWEKAEGMTTHEIIEEYPEPKPAYSTIATFLKILTNKNFIHSRKQEGGGKTFVFTPTISREAYTNRVMKEVKAPSSETLSNPCSPSSPNRKKCRKRICRKLWK